MKKEKEEITLDELKDNEVYIKELKEKIENGEKLSNEELKVFLDSLKSEPINDSWLWILLLIFILGFKDNKNPEKQVIINM